MHIHSSTVSPKAIQEIEKDYHSISYSPAFTAMKGFLYFFRNVQGHAFIYIFIKINKKNYDFPNLWEVLAIFQNLMDTCVFVPQQGQGHDSNQSHATKWTISGEELGQVQGSFCVRPCGEALRLKTGIK